MADTKAGESPFLQAWYDPVANLKVFSQSLRLVDLAGDNDVRLLAADLDKKLRVYKGIGVSSVHPLLDTPVSLAVFYPETSVPRVPAVAVAAGTFVFVYRNLRPYLKFTLPQVPMTQAEVDALAAYGKPPPGPAEVGGAGAASSSASSPSSSPPMKHTVVTCLESIPRDRDGEGEQSSLLVGTEAGQVLFLDAAGSSIERCVQLPSVPVHMVVHGTLKGDHRVNVSCRDGVVYALRDRDLLATRIEPPALPSALVRTNSYLYVASVDSRVTGYEPAGKKVFTLPLPQPVTAMARMLVRRDRTHDCVAIALEGGEVRVYNGDVQVASMQCPDTVVAMRFGQYGREANTLILASRSGALTFKMLKRTASFEVTEEHSKSGPPPEQDIPLAVPKKTRLYLDQTQRERDAAPDMYRVFQRDLTRLRLTTARAYVKVLTDGGATAGASSAASASSSSSAASGDASLRINCTVQGLGPRFTVRLDVQNAGQTSLPDVLVAVGYDKAIYHMDAPTQSLPLLLPNVRYAFEAPITCISPTGAADSVRIHILKGPPSAPAGGGPSAPVSTSGAAPIVTAVLAMPLSQPLPTEA